MNDYYSLSRPQQTVAITLVIIGFVTLIAGFYIDEKTTWANFLLNNYYFTSLAIGAIFFLSIQYITKSGWSALFIRIPMAIGAYIPFAGFIILFLAFGMPEMYHWSHPDAGLHDSVIAHKAPYLNIPFFFTRLVLFLVLWILMIELIRRASRKEDTEGGLKYFHKTESYSKIYIFIIAFTFSLATFDLIMSIDVHWFSTIFAIKNFVSGFYHAVAIIVLILILLNKRGYFPEMTRAHLHDFSRYIFMLATIWAYLWFVQYLLIWFTNIPEETIYFVTRTRGEWRVFFFLNIILNWVIPFITLLHSKLDQNRNAILFVCLILIIGQWVDLFLQIMPGSIGGFHIGLIEIGTFAGFAGLFVFIVGKALSKFPLVPKNHPFLNESLNHKTDS